MEFQYTSINVNNKFLLKYMLLANWWPRKYFLILVETGYGGYDNFNFNGNDVCLAYGPNRWMMGNSNSWAAHLNFSGTLHVRAMIPGNDGNNVKNHSDSIGTFSLYLKYTIDFGYLFILLYNYCSQLNCTTRTILPVILLK